MSALDTARAYISRGWTVVPIPAGRKGPAEQGWQHLRISLDGVSRIVQMILDLEGAAGRSSGSIDKQRAQVSTATTPEIPMARLMAGLHSTRSDLRDLLKTPRSHQRVLGRHKAIIILSRALSPGELGERHFISEHSHRLIGEFNTVESLSVW